MAKGYQGRHKGDIAIDNLLREAKNARMKEKRGIQDETIITKSMSKNKKKIKYKEYPKDEALTQAIAGGMTEQRAKERAKKRAEKLEAKKEETRLQELADMTGIPYEILKEKPSLRPMDWEGDEIEFAKREAEKEAEDNDADDEAETNSDSE